RAREARVSGDGLRPLAGTPRGGAQGGAHGWAQADLRPGGHAPPPVPQRLRRGDLDVHVVRLFRSAGGGPRSLARDRPGPARSWRMVLYAVKGLEPEGIRTVW